MIYNNTMRYRKLRIAWSVVWSLAAVLFCLLWVISYWCFGSIEYRLSSTSNLMVNCVKGCTYMGTMLDTDADDWNVTIEPLSSSVRSTVEEVRSENVTKNIDVFVPIDWEHDLHEGMNWRGHFGFGLSHSLGFQFITAPNWFLAVISATFAVAPWKLRLLRRFSLRTLLITTTLVALVLGLVVWATRQ
jgi:hypothetical protein